MNFDEMLEQVLKLVQRQGRVSYRAIKRRLDVDDDLLEDLKEELLFTHRQIVDEDGRGLVWIDDADVVSEPAAASPQPVPQPVAHDALSTAIEPVSRICRRRRHSCKRWQRGKHACDEELARDYRYFRV